MGCQWAHGVCGLQVVGGAARLGGGAAGAAALRGVGGMAGLSVEGGEHVVTHLLACTTARRGIEVWCEAARLARLHGTVLVTCQDLGAHVSSGVGHVVALRDSRACSAVRRSAARC